MPINRPIGFIFKPDVQRIFDYFSSYFRIRIVFYTPTGDMLRVGLKQPDSLYCRLVQKELYGEATCLNLDEVKRHEAVQKGKMVCYECHAGLVEAINPIYYEKKLLGFIAIGQFRSQDAPPPVVMRDCGVRDLADEVQAAYLSLPYVPAQQTTDFLGLFTILVDYIVTQGMILFMGDFILQKIISHVDSDPGERLSLADAARMVNRSTSTVSHEFKRRLGKSFKHTLTEIRLRKAEEYMTTHPYATVSDGGLAVGYADSSYFSRLYKRYRRIPPSRFLKRLKRMRAKG